MSTRQDVRKMRRIKGRQARRNRPSPYFTLDQRLTRMSQCSDTHVAYSPDMLGGRIDRGAWAIEIDALIDRFDRGNKSAFARRIGRTRQTVMRWLAQETDTSLESVRQVLDQLRLSQDEQGELLTRVGYLPAGGSMPAPPAYPNPREDPVIKQIMADPQLTEDQRADLVQVQLDLIEADVKRRQAEYERLIGYRGQRDAS
jgi:hypothetical protein